ERQLGDLADDVPARDVHRGGDAHDRLARPALLARDALRSQREHALIQTLGRERILANDQLGDAGAERVDRGLDRRVAGGDADALDAPAGGHAYQDLVRARHDEMADPVRAAFVGRAQDVYLKLRDPHGCPPRSREINRLAAVETSRSSPALALVLPFRRHRYADHGIARQDTQ